MNEPGPTELIMEWLHTNSPYKATLSKKGNGDPFNIEIRGKGQVAWLYLQEFKRWSVKPGLYLLADASAVEAWKPRELPPLGDPSYFDALLTHLKDGPKPFTA